MSLFSDKIRQSIEKTVIFGQKGHAHPFQWNEKLERPELCRSKRGRFLYNVNSGMSIFYFSFILVQCLRVNFASSSSIGSSSSSRSILKIYMRFVTTYYSFSAVTQLANILNQNQFLGFYHQFSTLMKQFEDGLRKSRQEDEEKTERKTLIPKAYGFFMDVMRLNIFVMGFGLIILSILRPQSPEFLSAVLTPFTGERKILKLLIRILSVLFQIHFQYLCTGSGMMWLLSGFGYTFSGIAVLRQIKALTSTGNGKGSKKNPPRLSREKVQRVLKMYRQMEILQKSLHDTFCTMIFPTVKIVAMTLTIFCTYGSFKMDGIVANFLGFLALIAIFVLVMLMETLAEFHKNSHEILSRMKLPQFQKELNLYEKKTIKSFNLIQIKMGSSYVIDKICVATVIKIVADSTVNFILANR